MMEVDMKNWEDIARQLGGYYMSLMEGDTHRIDSAMELLKEIEVIDEDGEMIYDEDEEEE